MKYQKIMKLLDNEYTQPSKFRTKKWTEIDNDSRETYNTNSQIEYKTTILKSSICHYSNVYILVKGTIIVANTTAEDADADITNKKVGFKNCILFTDCICEMNSTQVIILKILML